MGKDLSFSFTLKYFIAEGPSLSYNLPNLCDFDLLYFCHKCRSVIFLKKERERDTVMGELDIVVAFKLN